MQNVPIRIICAVNKYDMISMVETEGPVCYNIFILRCPAEILGSTVSFHYQIHHKKDKLPKMHSEPQTMCIKGLKMGLPWFHLC
jgi:hypothetical protein